MLSERELDEILARHGRDYNRPPEEMPLESVRARVFSSRSGPARRRVAGFGIAAAAAAAMIIVTISSAPEARRNTAITSLSTGNEVAPDFARLDARTDEANRLLIAAIRSAELAAAAHPGDSYYAGHLEAMTANAEHFRMIQQDRLGASL